MKSSKKVNWKPPEAMEKVGFKFIDKFVSEQKTKFSEKRKSIQDQINAELNEMSMTMTEWYVEGEKNGRA
jgi:hypothetical protein